MKTPCTEINYTFNGQTWLAAIRGKPVAEAEDIDTCRKCAHYWLDVRRLTLKKKNTSTRIIPKNPR